MSPTPSSAPSSPSAPVPLPPSGPSTSAIAYRVVIYGLLYLTMILGLPVYHYATALLIAVLVRHANRGGGFFSAFESAPLPRLGAVARRPAVPPSAPPSISR